MVYPARVLNNNRVADWVKSNCWKLHPLEVNMNSTTTVRPLALIALLFSLVFAESEPASAEVWAACGFRDKESKVVRTFPRKKFSIPSWSVSGVISNLTCGNISYGYQHIKARHQTDWEDKAAIASMNWRDLADLGIASALSDPDKMSVKTNNEGKKDRLCYSREIFLYDKRSGRIVGSTHATVIVRLYDMDIITAYPSRTPRC